MLIFENRKFAADVLSVDGARNALEVYNFVLKLRNSALKMRNFGRRSGSRRRNGARDVSFSDSFVVAANSHVWNGL